MRQGPIRCAAMLLAAGTAVLPAGAQDAAELEIRNAVEVQGNSALGLVHVVELGCGVCHDIPGIRGADGIVGPPLGGFAVRPFIAGKIPNTPDMLVSWLDDPPALDPETGMPDVGLDQTTARHVAAFLATLR